MLDLLLFCYILLVIRGIAWFFCHCLSKIKKKKEKKRGGIDNRSRSLLDIIQM